MPTFSNVPPADPRGPALQLVRTPTHVAFKAIVTSDDLLGCFTHFWRGRTLPCDVDDCEACRQGMPFRWHAWVSCWTPKPARHLLFEMTAQAAETFVQYRDANEGLRGCEFTAWRPSRKPNGRVYVTTRKGPLFDHQLPKAPNLIQCLSIIWHVALPSFNVHDCLKGIPRVTMNDSSQPILHNGNGDDRHHSHETA